MTLAIDFDGVLHDHKNPKVGRKMGAPISGAKEALQFFRERGDRIIIHSVWGDRERIIREWMNYYLIPFDEITNIKPDADVYLDDRGLRFENWEQALVDLHRLYLKDK
jgi:hypothetical protein